MIQYGYNGLEITVQLLPYLPDCALVNPCHHGSQPLVEGSCKSSQAGHTIPQTI